MTSVIRVGQSKFAAVPIDEDSQERIMNCIETLAQLQGSKVVKQVFLQDTKAAYGRMVATEEKKARAKREQATKGTGVQADDLISFRQLSKKSAGGDSDDNDIDLIRATGAEVQEDFASKLSRIVQLTGFSDPVYAEAVVTIQQFDVVLEVLIVNQTTTTHQNLTIDFATLGDLKLVERPAPHTIGPHGFHHITATIKVSSTETGVIFGNATFDKEGASDASVNIVLSDIQYVQLLIRCYILLTSPVSTYLTGSSHITSTKLNSGACGPNSNGKTRSPSRPRHQISGDTSTT